MRSRLLDVVLIVGLVVVAGGIMWTLFNLGSPGRTATTPTAPSAPAAGSGSPTITPVAPSSTTAPSQTAPSTVGSAASGATPADPATPDAGATPAADATPATPVEPAPRAVPPGTVALERVGFSFVTGGAGACGVVLEPWTHVAVSRDLLAAYGCGAEVTVTLDDPAGGRSEVVGVIGDTMNPSFELTVNVYVGADEPAFQYGLTTGTFTPRWRGGGGGHGPRRRPRSCAAPEQRPAVLGAAARPPELLGASLARDYAPRQRSARLTSSIARVIGMSRGQASVQLYAVRQRQRPLAWLSTLRRSPAP